MKRINKFKMEFDAISQNESFARGVVGAFLARLNPSIDEINDVKTAVSEAVTNAIVHGYEGRENGIITLSVLIDGMLATITIEDKGEGIPDIEKAKEPFYTTKPEEERSGMGFTVMESFMDSVEVRSGKKGTVVILKKELGKCFHMRRLSL
ncbi:MAG: anti-sigma F factor [Firmicutes bacterium]|nr:anti-sigma F factor [Bacillota bacterium]